MKHMAKMLILMLSISILTGCSFIPKDKILDTLDTVKDKVEEVVNKPEYTELTPEELKEVVIIDNENKMLTKETLPDDALEVDLDSDGLTNQEEIEIGTDIYKSDTDEDGIMDGEEVKNTKTSPLKWSSREDGKSDLDWYVSQEDSKFERGWTGLNRLGFRTWLEKPEDRLYVYSTVSTEIFNNLETVSEAIQIKHFSGKLAVDCSAFIDEVANSIIIYKDVDSVPTKVDSMVTEKNLIEFIVNDGDIFVLTYQEPAND